MTTTTASGSAPVTNSSNYQQLYKATILGDWETARSILESDPNALTAIITPELDLPILLCAARSCQWQFILKLLQLLPPEAVLARNPFNGFTALHYVAYEGNIKLAKALVSKNSASPQIMNKDGHTPLISSLMNPHKEFVWYLCLVTRDENPSLPYTGPQSSSLIEFLSKAGFHDITIYLLDRYPSLAFAKDKQGRHLLFWLALKPSDFLSGSRLTFWQTFMYPFVHVEIKHAPPYSVILDMEDSSMRLKSITTQVFQWVKRLLWKAIQQLAPSLEEVRDAKLKNKCVIELVNNVCTQVENSNMNIDNQVRDFLMSALFFATKFGIIEIVRTCLQHFPNLVMYAVAYNRNVLQAAVEFRQETIFNLVKHNSALSRNLAIDQVGSGNYTFQLVAMLAPSTRLLSVSGTALQMQRELQWFKEVEKLLRPILKTWRNDGQKTADDLFREQHKELAEKGEKWMKDTANSCMVVSTLIATVVFAAAFTVPGGNISDKGIPIFLWNNSFTVFIISDVLALFASSTSLLMFLSILTARYAQEDFLLTLPKRLIMGLGSLFFAIAAMMVAFVATLSLVLGERWEWVFIPVTLLASFPVAIFGMLQLPLFIQMVQSTYGSGIFHP